MKQHQQQQHQQKHCNLRSSSASLALLAMLLLCSTDAISGVAAFSSPGAVAVRTAASRNANANAIHFKSIAGGSNSGSGSGTSLNAFPAKLSQLPLAFTSTATVAASSISSLAALSSVISGGIFSGSLHAIAGPDHLAALIPRCCGLPWYKAARVGAVWGLGHGVSATLLGIAGFLFKKGVRLTGLTTINLSSNFNLLHHAGSFMELAIGISLIVIGLIGIKEAKEWEVPDESACEVVDADGNISVVYQSTTDNTPNPRKRAVLFNGILHGFSWDGAPSLAPAIAISTWKGSLTFLLSYALGTMAAMTVATTLIGEGTRRASFHLDRPDLPRDLSVGSSFLALLVGVVWCWLALR